jgi:NTP pyrophosphatase (non-canonical NTP hydrolase)
MTPDDSKFLSDVHREVDRARDKFPGSNLVLAALTEEVGELAQAMLKRRAGKMTDKDVWNEAVQVAAMALRCAVEGDPSFNAVAYSEPGGLKSDVA